jgi:hypothetical protein
MRISVKKLVTIGGTILFGSVFLAVALPLNIYLERRKKE